MFDANWQVYVLCKVWREGLDVARCIVARLMKPMGKYLGQGAQDENPDKKQPCPLDKVLPLLVLAVTRFRQ